MKKTNLKETTVVEPRSFYIIVSSKPRGLFAYVQIDPSFQDDFLFYLHSSICSCRIPSSRGLRFFFTARNLYDFVPPLCSPKAFLFQAFADAYVTASINPF